MKKNIFYLLVVAMAGALVACENTNNSASESLEPSISISDSTQTSTSTYPNVFNENQIFTLINNLPFGDVNSLSSETKLDIYGLVSGMRFHQTQVINERTYSNDVTIGTGSVKQTYPDSPNLVYESDMTILRMLEDDRYYDITIYENKDFTSTTDSLNLNLFTDASELETARQDIKEFYIPCGIGYEAFLDFAQGYNMGANLAFQSEYTNNKTNVILTAYMDLESSNTNQYYKATFTYLIDLRDYHIIKYDAEQAYYRLLDYQLNNNSLEGLEPIDYVLQETEVTNGTRDAYTDDLPFDITSLYVSQINLSVAKTEIQVGETVAIKSTVLPETAINKDLMFSSNNKAIASVDSSGRVRGLSAGTCKIIAENIESGVTGEIEITVKDAERPDPGDDTKKDDLAEALSLVSKQVFSTPTSVIDNGSFEFSSPGIVIDSEQTINTEELAKLTISEFAYDENTRTAVYVGDWSKLDSIIPFYDNGVEALSNRYFIKERERTIYREVIVKFELVLASSNEIEYIKVVGRTDSISFDTPIDKTILTNENVDSLGELSVNSLTKNIYYESRGMLNE